MKHAANGPLIVDIAGLELTAEDKELLAHPAVGGIILFTRNFADTQQLHALTQAIRAHRSNLLICADYEGGRVQRFQTGVTRIPAMQRLGKLYQQDIQQALATATEIGWLIASELGALGIDMPLAPVVDLNYGASEIIGNRAFSSDSTTTTKLAQALIHGLRQAGSIGTAKHFPGHGYVAPDSHKELPVDARDEQALAKDIQPYQALIQNNLASIMMAHICYPAVDERPASLSPVWIEEILRKQHGFKGSVFCDDLSMGGAAAYGSYTDRAQMALAAGCDWLPVCNNREGVAELVGDTQALSEDRGQAFRQAMMARLQPSVRQASLQQLAEQPRWQQIQQMIAALNEKLA